MKKLKRSRIIMFFIIIFLFPTVSFILWYLQKPKVLNILIIDKTVPASVRYEHKSFNWILNYNNYTKPDKHSYSINNDYLGFFPINIPNKKDSGKYLIRDLDKFLNIQLDSIADKLDVLYFTDTYGVYYNDWYKHKMLGEHSEEIYGGLSDNDISLIQYMKEKKKLVIAEFNFFASPTKYINRVRAEQLVGIHWKGWTFRYFDMLDTLVNPELPHWIVELYKKQHNNKWNFKNSGIVFHHDADDIIDVLDADVNLTRETPYILTDKETQKKYHLPSEIYYPYWFDYTDTIGNKNEIIAHYKIFTNKKGDSILNRYNLTNLYPCIIRHKIPGDYTFYYFCGDFADNPVNKFSSYFKGIRKFDFLFYTNKPNDRAKFFWKYYYPLVNTIMKEYYTKKHLALSTVH